VRGTIRRAVVAEDIRHFEPGSLHGKERSEVRRRPGRFRR
jgi:hypothetical protein